MTKFKRLQQRRVGRSTLPKDTAVVSRPSFWGKHFPMCPPEQAERHVEEFRRWVEHHLTNPQTRIEMRMRLEAIRGKHLACWCAPTRACHADVLLDLANTPEQETWGWANPQPATQRERDHAIERHRKQVRKTFHQGGSVLWAARVHRKRPSCKMRSWIRERLSRSYTAPRMMI